MQALNWVSEAYLLHLMSKHRRPVYRHINGDIALNMPSIHAFIDGYLAEKRSSEKREQIYLTLLDFDAMDKAGDPSLLVDWGGIPMLNARGLRLINAMFNRLGYMAMDVDFTNCDVLAKYKKETAGDGSN